MKILVVDDERLALENIISLIRRVLPEAEIYGFMKSAEALEWLRENHAEIAFLDIEMVGMNGLTLAEKCKNICPSINIIFVTGYVQYTMEAFKVHASGYLIKPVRDSDLRQELDNLRYTLPKQVVQRVKIQTFGNFEVFVDGKLLFMPGTKMRECLAYLVDRKGARVSTAQLAAILWEERVYDKKLQNNTYRVISDMIRYLSDVGVRDIIIKSRKEIAIDKEKIDCDYYHFLEGNKSPSVSFFGEYMTNYTWAETTLAALLKISG